MPFKLTVNLPGTARNAEVQILGLGTYKNGSTNNVTDEEAEAFRVYQRDAALPDRTLVQTFKDSSFVKVTADQGPKPKNEDNDNDKKDGEK